jgi:proteasome alpha subunit
MSMPFYVSPEQQMKDRADFARKGIARGRNSLVLAYDGGIAFVAENLSSALHKVSEIYDRIAFTAVGRYNEFENLRIAGVRMADVRGYSYARLDVTSRNLANTYAQVLGTIFSSVGEKPYEVEIMVAEVGDTAADDQIYRLTFDGSVADEHGFAAMGGSAEEITTALRATWKPGLPLADVLDIAVRALGGAAAADRDVDGARLEVAVLDRSRVQQRKFKRIDGPVLARLLESGRADTVAVTAAEASTAANEIGSAPTEPTASPTPESG